ncbi:MAG: YggT family protein [Chloroflexota bacterium]
MGIDNISGFIRFFADTLITILSMAIIVRSLMSWFNPSPDNPIVRFVVEITEPILQPLGRIVPRIGMIDITPMVAILLLMAIQQFLNSTL